MSSSRKLTAKVPSIDEVVRKFAIWFVHRQQSEFPVGHVRRATVQLWAEQQNLSLTTEEIAYIFEHYLDHVSIRSAM